MFDSWGTLNQSSRDDEASTKTETFCNNFVALMCQNPYPLEDASTTSSWCLAFPLGAFQIWYHFSKSLNKIQQPTPSHGLHPPHPLLHIYAPIKFASFENLTKYSNFALHGHYTNLNILYPVASGPLLRRYNS